MNDQPNSISYDANGEARLFDGPRAVNLFACAAVASALRVARCACTPRPRCR